MNFIFNYLLMIALAVFNVTLLGADPISNSDNSYEQELKTLDWKVVGTYKLSKSHSSLSVPEEHLALIGLDAQKLDCLNGNEEDFALEAVTLGGSEFTETVYFHNYNEGNVSINDWSDVNSKQMIASISENTEKSNKIRVEKGFEGRLHVVGWIQEPTLDKNTNTVFWSIECKSDGENEHSFNSIALRLGRTGYEKLTWVGSLSQYKAFGGELDVMLRAHSFDPGYRYTDYTPGDKVATYGVATLVAATLGAKIVKTTGFLLIFKKFGVFFVAAIVASFRKIKNFFWRTKGDDVS